MIHYSADGTLAVVHGLLPVGRRMVTARLVLVEARHCCRTSCFFATRLRD